MILARKQLFHLPVETVSGQKLGRVIDVEIDQETHGVARYHIAKGELVIPGLSTGTLLVAPSQVVSINDKKMVVDDALVQDPLVAPEPAD